MANQEVSSRTTNDRIQQIQEEPVPAEGVKRVDEPNHPTDHEHPTERQDRESGCGLRFTNANDTENREQNTGGEKPSPRSPDLLEAGSENITKTGHCFSP